MYRTLPVALLYLGKPGIHRHGSQFDGSLGILREQVGGLTITIAPDTDRVRLVWWVPKGAQTPYPQEIHVDSLGYRVVGSTAPSKGQMEWIIWLQAQMETP